MKIASYAYVISTLRPRRMGYQAIKIPPLWSWLLFARCMALIQVLESTSRLQVYHPISSASKMRGLQLSIACFQARQTRPISLPFSASSNLGSELLVSPCVATSMCPLRSKTWKICFASDTNRVWCLACPEPCRSHIATP
jgi:hypothetical protein